MPQKAPSLNSVVEVIVVDDSQTPTTPANQNNNFNANHDNTNVEKLLDPSVLELSLEKVIDLETGDDPTHKKFMDKSKENILTENQQEKSSPGITTRRISTPSIIPDETIEVTNSQEHGSSHSSSQSLKLQTEQPTATSELVDLLQMSNSTVNSKQTPGELEKLNLEKGNKRKLKPSMASIPSSSKSEENSNITITFSNIGVHVIEKIQKLLEEEYVKNDSKKSKRKSKSICSGSIEANPLFITEKINYDERYLKNLNIEVEDSSEEESALTTNSNQTNKTCYNCLGIGHILAECPYELDFDEIDKNRDSFRKKATTRIFEAFGPTPKRSEKKSPLDIKNFAVRLSEKAKKTTSRSVLASYKGETPQNKIHEKDIGTVSEEFLYGGAPIEASNFEEKKQKLSKVFTRLKEHKEFEKKRKFDQFSTDETHNYIHIRESQEKSSSQERSKKSKEPYHKKKKQSYDKSYDDGDNLEPRQRYRFKEFFGERDGRRNNSRESRSTNNTDRYYYDHYDDEFERGFHQRRYNNDDSTPRTNQSKKKNDSKNQSYAKKQNSKRK